MKKILFVAATFAALTIITTACGGNKTSDAENNADTSAVVSDSASADNASALETTPEAASSAADEAIAQLNAATAKGQENPEQVKQTINQVKQKIQELQASGNQEAAKAYASKLQSYLS